MCDCDLPGRLSLLRTLPSFLVAPPSTSRFQKPVDVSAILASARVATQDCDYCFGSEESLPMQMEMMWIRGYCLPLLAELANAHISTSTHVEENVNEPPVFSSLSSMLAATELYLGTVLRVIDVEWKPYVNLAPYTIRVLVRDLVTSSGSIGAWDAAHRDLWFWKAFVAWASMSLVPGGVGDMEILLYTCIREWSQTWGILDWEDARNVLRRVVWPEVNPHAIPFEAMWMDIMIE